MKTNTHCLLEHPIRFEQYGKKLIFEIYKKHNRTWVIIIYYKQQLSVPFSS